MNLRNNKGISKVLLPLVIIILAILTCFLVYITNNNKVKEAEKFEQDSYKKEISQTNNSLNNNSNINYEYKDIIGTYKTKKADSAVILCLNDDGTFLYSVGTDTMSGCCGNYIINDSKITLNNLFMFGSDTSLTLVEDSTKTVNKQDTLVINNDGTIIDKTSLDGLGTRTEADKTLTKSSTSIDESLTLKNRIKVAIDDNGFQFNESNNISKTNTEDLNNKYSNIIGTYKTKNADSSVMLCLNNDGTFLYSVGTDTMSGCCGNYIINDSKITLNNLFVFGSDTSLTLVGDSTKTVNKQDTLVINDDGTITDKTSLDGLGTRTEADKTLTKSSTSIDKTLTLINKIKIAIKDNGFQK